MTNIVGQSPSTNVVRVGPDGTISTARAGKAVWAALDITKGRLIYENLGAAVASVALTTSATPGLYLVAYDLEVTTADAGATSVAFQVNYTDRIGARTWNQATVALTGTNRQSAILPLYLKSGEISVQTNVVTIGTAKYALAVGIVPC